MTNGELWRNIASIGDSSGVAGFGFGRLFVAASGRRRGLKGMEESRRRGGDLLYRRQKLGFVGPRGLGETGYLADELKAGGADFGFRHRRVEIEKRLDAAAHGGFKIAEDSSHHSAAGHPGSEFPRCGEFGPDECKNQIVRGQSGERLLVAERLRLARQMHKKRNVVVRPPIVESRTFGRPVSGGRPQITARVVGRKNERRAVPLARRHQSSMDVAQQRVCQVQIVGVGMKAVKRRLMGGTIPDCRGMRDGVVEKEEVEAPIAEEPERILVEIAGEAEVIGAGEVGGAPIERSEAESGDDSRTGPRKLIAPKRQRATPGTEELDVGPP